MSNSAQEREPWYRVFLNRTQHLNSSVKLWRESREEVLQVAPARIVSRLADERLDLLKASSNNGVKWRWITDVRESNMRDVRLISRYAEVRHCPNLSFRLTIFDRSVVFFCANPTFVSAPENAGEAHFTFEDPSVAQAFVMLFESLWKTSSNLTSALTSIETLQIEQPTLGEI